MTAQEILKMIETVDPYDSAKLDEIDARVCCYLNHKPYVSHKRAESMSLEVLGWLTVNTGTPEIISFFSSYTRSRDALKAIRPDGVLVFVKPFAGNQSRIAWAGYVVGAFIEPQGLPTEELAELHAIIQAIDHDRQ